MLTYQHKENKCTACKQVFYIWIVNADNSLRCLHASTSFDLAYEWRHFAIDVFINVELVVSNKV